MITTTPTFGVANAGNPWGPAAVTPCQCSYTLPNSPCPVPPVNPLQTTSAFLPPFPAAELTGRGSSPATSSTTSRRTRPMTKKTRPSSARPGASTTKTPTTQSPRWYRMVSEEEDLARRITGATEAVEASLLELDKLRETTPPLLQGTSATEGSHSSPSTSSLTAGTPWPNTFAQS